MQDYRVLHAFLQEFIKEQKNRILQKSLNTSLDLWRRPLRDQSRIFLTLRGKRKGAKTQRKLYFSFLSDFAFFFFLFALKKMQDSSHFSFYPGLLTLSSGGKSARSRKPKCCKNSFVVPYKVGRPGTSILPTG